MDSALAERVRRAAEVAGEHADRAEELRRLPAEVVEALAESGLFTLCLPAAYGGPGFGPGALVDAVVEVARADAAAGWCAGIASTTASLAVFLDPDAARTVYASPATATGGVFAPNARAVRDGDGYRVTGRWQWGSGTQHCSWIVGGAIADDGAQLVCFFPASDVTFHDTWHTSGLRGTGSLDFSVDEARVPTELAIRVGVDGAHVEEPLGRFPNFTLLALGITATALGVARRALDELVELAAGKVPQFSSKSLAESAFAQTELARAEAAWRSARAYLGAELDAAWATAVAGDEVTVEDRVGIRLAATHAVTASVSAVDTAWTLAGGTAVYDTSVLGRCLRDVHVVTQHIMVAPKLNETLGRFLFGVAFNPAMI